MVLADTERFVCRRFTGAVARVINCLGSEREQSGNETRPREQTVGKGKKNPNQNSKFLSKCESETRICIKRSVCSSDEGRYSETAESSKSRFSAFFLLCSSLVFSTFRRASPSYPQPLRLLRVMCLMRFFCRVVTFNSDTVVRFTFFAKAYIVLGLVFLAFEKRKNRGNRPGCRQQVSSI